MEHRLACTALFIVALLAYHAPTGAALAACVGAAIGAFFHPRLRDRRSLTYLTLALASGFLRAGTDAALWSRGSMPQDGAKVVLIGTVLEAPRLWGSSTVFLFSVQGREDEPTRGEPIVVLVRWANCAEPIAPGDRWKLEGRFSPGEAASYPGGFSQRFWLWTARARGTLKVGKFSLVSYQGPPRGMAMQAVACRLRARMLARLSAIPHLEARALVEGVVFGETQTLPKDLQDAFRRTGTSHLLAASGTNVALLIGFFLAGARFLGYGPWRVAPWAAPFVVLYAFLAGCAPSIARAATGASMALLALYLGRSSSAWNSLCLSIWMLLLWEPRMVYDVGFQLSAAAVVGLIAGPTLDGKAPSWKKNALMTVSASLLTLPFMWTTFHELSSTLLISNLILGPIVELLFPLGLLLVTLPYQPLVWFVETIARISLFLVKALSAFADPLPLARPELSSLALLGAAIGLWLWARAGHWRWLALPLAALALLHGQLAGYHPTVEPGELLIRRVAGSGGDQPLYWLSSQHEELLVLSEPWQETRARSMMLDAGCLRRPELKVLDKAHPFEVRWGAFSWLKIRKLLPEAPYLEVRTTGCTYTAKPWRYDGENGEGTY